MTANGKILGRPFITGAVTAFLLYFAIGASIPLLPRLVTNGLGGNKADVGRLAAVFAVAAVGCRPLVAVVSRQGARRTAQLGTLLSALGFALMWKVPNLGVLSASRVLTAVGEALVWVACNTLATAHAPSHRQAEAVSLSSASIFLAIGIGPLTTEALSRSGRFDTAALVPVGACILSALITLLMKPEWDPPQHDARRRLTWHEVVHPAALVPGLALGLLIVGWSSWSNFVALRADEVGLSNAAILFTIYSAVSLLIRLGGARLPERLGLTRCAAASGVAVAAALLVLGQARTAVGLYAGAAAMAVGVGLSFPSMSALALSGIRSAAERAPLLSSFGMFFDVGTGVGGLLIGPVAKRSGLPTAFRVSAIAPMLAMAVVLIGMRRRAVT